MNLTPEELQFFRAQRLAASTEAIAFNHALCGQLLAVIPQTQQPGPSFPVPLATMTHMELNAWKDLLVQFFDGKNCYAQMLPILANWKPDIMAVAPAPPALSDNQKADALLMALTNEHHATLSFNFRVPMGSANYDQLHTQHNSAMLRNISPDLLTAIKTSLVRQFPENLAQYAEISYDAIPEDVFVKFLLLKMSTVNETDKEDMTTEFQKIRMQQSPNFDFAAYRLFVGQFLRLREMFRPYLKSWSNKRWAELFRDGLQGSLLFDKANELAKGVSEADIGNFDIFREAIETDATALKQTSNTHPKIAAAAVREERDKARKASSAGRTARVVTAIPSDSDQHAAKKSWKDRPLSKGQKCFNCPATHKVFECEEACRLSTCTLPTEKHSAKDCPSILNDALFQQLLKVEYNPISKSPITTDSSCHSCHSGRPLKRAARNQYDTGSNVVVSTGKALFGGVVTPATTEDTITAADGRHMKISGTFPVGNDIGHVIDRATDNLIPQRCLENSGLATLLVDSQLYLINNESAKSLLSTLDPKDIVSTIQSDNDQYFFSEQVMSNIAKRLSNKSTCVARYHTIRFPTLKDLVIFWHHNLDHINITKLISIVENKLIKGLPTELTVQAIRKYFPHDCLPCSIGNLQSLSHPLASIFNRKVPIGAWWSIDFKKMSGTDKERQVTSYSGSTHLFIAIDYASSRVYIKGAKGTKNAVQYIKSLDEFNTRKGYTMQGLSLDAEFATKQVVAYLQNPSTNKEYTVRHKEGDETRYTTSTDLIIMRAQAIPYEHFTLGEIERFNRTIHETTTKKATAQSSANDDRLWESSAYDTVDKFNACPTSNHPTASPYQLYDKFTLDLGQTPLLPFGITVVAQIPPPLQTVRTGRGFEAVVTGRAPEHSHGIKLFNPATKREITRRTFKVIGDHPIKGLVFNDPITIEISPEDDEIEITDNNEAYLSKIVSGTANNYDNIQLPKTDEPAATALILPTADLPADDENIDYMPLKTQLKKQKYVKRYLNKIGKKFKDEEILFQIADVVSEKDKPKSLFFKYFDSSKPIPVTDTDFEYSVCSDVLQGDWADFNFAKYVAKAITKARKTNMPTNYESMLKHEQYALLNEAMLIEFDSWKELDAIHPNFKDIDWTTVNPKDIGDLMLIFDKKFKPDGTFEKFKCRMVFRGDRWINKENLSVYSTGVHIDALMLFLAIVATEDLDLWKLDVKTAFLYGKFPTGMTQYVRSPHGVPSNILPKKFQLGSCVYGHPLANSQWDKEFKSTLSSACAINTDDTLFATPFDSILKQNIKNQANEKYHTTTEDPAVNYLGMTLVRNRNERTIDIFLPKFMQEMTIKYPLLPDAKYPSTPMASSRYLSIADRKDKEILLSIEQISKMREIIGDLLWIAMHTKPTIKYALNVYSRKISPNPTQFDYNQLLRIMHYCIGTKDEPRRIGGKHGVSLQATVDSSFPSTDDMKGQSAYSIHVSGGGAVIFDTHKHTATAGSSAESEIYGNSYADKSIKWARNFCLELGQIYQMGQKLLSRTRL